jgi:putative SOS response-associated peptidase YedK
MCNQFQQGMDLTEVSVHFEADVAAMRMMLNAEQEQHAATCHPLRAHLFPKYPTITILPGRQVELLSWGFKHPTLDKVVNNARCETVDRSPLFRAAFKGKRCLIPATGFIEFSPQKRKYLITVAEGGLFAFAGLYRPGEVTMLTCGPNPFMERIHNRMPVILHKRDYDRWLTEGGKDLLTPYAGELKAIVLAESRVKQHRGPMFEQPGLF